MLVLSQFVFALRFVYITSQLRHFLEVQALLRKLFDPPLNFHFQKEAMRKHFGPCERALIRGWVLINFSPFSKIVVC